VTPAPVAPPLPPSASPPSSSPSPPAAAPSPSAPATAPAAEKTVSATVLDANRSAGDKEILPDETTQSEIARSGMGQINGSFKICVTDDGSINTVSMLKSTGFPSYDVKIQSTIRKTWRYRPIIVSGKPTPVCTAVRFVYRQG
jgi:periplasmic protein TonB